MDINAKELDTVAFLFNIFNIFPTNLTEETYIFATQRDIILERERERERMSADEIGGTFFLVRFANRGVIS